MEWFQNNKCGVPFDKGATSTDFCLQMAEAIHNFEIWKDEGGSYAKPTQKQIDISKRPSFSQRNIPQGTGH